MYRDIKISESGKFFEDFPIPLVADDIGVYRICFPLKKYTDACYIKVTAMRADGRTVTDGANIKGDTAYYVMAKNMYAVSGTLDLRISLLNKDNNALTTKMMSFDVLEAWEDDIDGENRHPIINDVIIMAQNAMMLIKNHETNEELQHPNESVKTKHIAQKSVTSDKLADGAVSAAALSTDVAALIKKADTVEEKVFFVSAAETRYELILGADIPQLSIRGSNIATGEYASLDMNDAAAVIRINGESFSAIESDECIIDIPTSEESYITARYDTELGTVSYSRSAEYVPSAFANGSWNVTLYKYSNINLNLIPGDTEDEDTLEIERYSAEYASVNEDSSGAVYMLTYNHIVPERIGTLSDLKTKDKNSIIAAVNENAEKISALEDTVGTANAVLEEILSEGV